MSHVHLYVAQSGVDPQRAPKPATSQSLKGQTPQPKPKQVAAPPPSFPETGGRRLGFAGDDAASASAAIGALTLLPGPSPLVSSRLCRCCGKLNLRPDNHRRKNSPATEGAHVRFHADPRPGPSWGGPPVAHGNGVGSSSSSSGARDGGSRAVGSTRRDSPTAREAGALLLGDGSHPVLPAATGCWQVCSSGPNVACASSAGFCVVCRACSSATPSVQERGLASH